MVVPAARKGIGIIMNDINKKLQDILSGLNASKLRGQNVSSILSSSEAEKIKNKLSPTDKQKIMSTFSGMSNEEIRRKLSNADLNSISKMSADDIIKKLKNL